MRKNRSMASVKLNSVLNSEADLMTMACSSRLLGIIDFTVLSNAITQFKKSDSSKTLNALFRSSTTTTIYIRRKPDIRKDK